MISAWADVAMTDANKITVRAFTFVLHLPFVGQGMDRDGKGTKPPRSFAAPEIQRRSQLAPVSAATGPRVVFSFALAMFVAFTRPRDLLPRAKYLLQRANLTLSRSAPATTPTAGRAVRKSSALWVRHAPYLPSRNFAACLASIPRARPDHADGSQPS